MGEVYRAVDTRLGRSVAIKVSRERFGARFEREARAISCLNHPNVCTLYDIGPNYLVMELVDGHSLRELLRRGLPSERGMQMARQVIEALSAAHRTGVIHRDLKPQNVMVRADGYVKVLDFGLAKFLQAAQHETGPTATIGPTEPGQVPGTAAYMSPEQIRGADVDQRSDLFAFGILFYEMLTGRHPWRRPSLVETVHAILHDDPPAMDLPLNVGLSTAAVEHVVRRSLAKQPEERFQTMGELRTALEQAATDVASKPAERRPSIAVLPFVNLSADKENEYFGDGLAEEVINALAHESGIKVAARTSSFFFRGKEVGCGEIGKKLHVEHILEGSVRKAANRIRVTAQLVAVADGFHLWSGRYDREMTDIFAIQDEITQAIASALRIKLSPDSVAIRRYTPNLPAYAAYLEARAHWVRPTPESLEHVKQCLEDAIELDPKFALAHSLLGAHYTMLGNLGFRPAREVIPLARAAEREALRVEPSLPEAHALLGVCDGTDYEWKDAEREWSLAMAQEPVSRDVRFWFGNHYLLPIGRLVEAVESMATFPWLCLLWAPSALSRTGLKKRFR
jgi:TolB-like protein